MAGRRDSDGLVAVGQLIDDPVAADAQRAQASQSAAQGMSRVRLPLEQPEGLLDGLDQWPVELKQLASGATRDDDASQRSATGSALGELLTKALQRDGVVALEV